MKPSVQLRAVQKNRKDRMERGQAKPVFTGKGKSSATTCCYMYLFEKIDVFLFKGSCAGAN
jgi:hypothetical protein